MTTFPVADFWVSFLVFIVFGALLGVLVAPRGRRLDEIFIGFMLGVTVWLIVWVVQIAAHFIVKAW